MNGLDLEKMRIKLLDVIDSDNPYSQSDFDNEFFSKSTNISTPDDYKIKLKFLNKSTNQDPQYATSGSSGFDLRANLVNDILIKSGTRETIPTGLYFEIPENFEIQVRPRSGLVMKNGVTVLNTPGTIDSDYRGEIKLILINLGKEDFVVKHGDRVAQGVLAAVTAKNVVNLTRVNEINNNTERSDNGFGSTGIK